MGAAQAPIRGRGAPVPPGDKRAGRPSRDGEEQPETVACFALPAFCLGSYGSYGSTRTGRGPNTWSRVDFGMGSRGEFRPEGSGHCVTPLESRPPTRTRLGMEGGLGARPQTVGSADRWAKRSAERGEGRSPNGVEEGGRGAAPPRVQGGALARPYRR